MNRQQRRAAAARGAPSGGPAAAATALKLCAEGAWQQQQGRLEEAIRLYRRALALKPDFDKALNNLGSALLAQGKRDKAAAAFKDLLLLRPELLDSYAEVVALLIQVQPAIGAAINRASAAWPRLPSVEDLFGAAGLSGIAGDPLLITLLASGVVRDAGLERLLTALRADLVRRAAATEPPSVDDAMLELFCGLAAQCFINEYVYAVSPEEEEQVETLIARISERLAADALIPPLWPVAVASHCPLHATECADGLLRRSWPKPVARLLTQQIAEPQEERRERDTIPRLTAITDEVSGAARRQYEENPYPRWVLPPSRGEAVDLNAYLRREFPDGRWSEIDTASGLDLLVAGCGTGQHPVGMAQLLRGARVLAVDLSLSSLAYARRRTRALGLANIEYAQADILGLGALGRTFDVIDCSGVLHHLADPFAGWRVLLDLLRPRGLMRVGLYSELARSAVVAARRFIAERGYRPTTEDIRRCRQDLLSGPLRHIAAVYDFFSTSECRDLLFHVQEHRLSIPQIKAFLADRRLTFIGFNVGESVRARYRARYPRDPAMTDLDNWHAFEQDNPATFAGMYQFWIQKE